MQLFFYYGLGGAVLSALYMRLVMRLSGFRDRQILAAFSTILFVVGGLLSAVFSPALSFSSLGLAAIVLVVTVFALLEIIALNIMRVVRDDDSLPPRQSLFLMPVIAPVVLSWAWFVILFITQGVIPFFSSLF